MMVTICPYANVAPQVNMTTMTFDLSDLGRGCSLKCAKTQIHPDHARCGYPTEDMIQLIEAVAPSHARSRDRCGHFGLQ